MTDQDLKEIRRHVVLLFIAAVVIALDVFYWRP
jgi:hypothetical protein